MVIGNSQVLAHTCHARYLIWHDCGFQLVSVVEILVLPSLDLQIPAQGVECISMNMLVICMINQVLFIDEY